jgi:DNA-binding transcriptional LysR family regulator
MLKSIPVIQFLDQRGTARAASRLKLRQLQLLHALGECSSLRQAAERVNLSQPAATRLLRELESALEARLFERSKRGLSPTPLGEAMVRHALVLLADLDSARAELRALAGGANGRVAIGTLFSTAPVLIPRSIVCVKASQPALRIQVREGSHDQLLPALCRGELDLMLGRLSSGIGDDVAVETLYEGGFCVVSGPQNRLAQRKRLTLKELQAASWVLPPENTPLRQQFDARFAAQCGRGPGDVVESLSFPTNITLLRDTDRIALFPQEVATYYSQLGLVRTLALPAQRLLGPVALFFRRMTPRSPAAEAFVAALKATVRELKKAA